MHNVFEEKGYIQIKVKNKINAVLIHATYPHQEITIIGWNKKRRGKDLSDLEFP